MKHSTRGFTVLLATLVASIALALGIAVFSLAQKQVELSRLGRDSQVAFYAADTAAECALFWDLRFGYFATTAPASVTDPRCGGQALVVAGRQPTLPQSQTFQFAPNGVCAQVTVTKSVTSPRTIIHADGFNSTCETLSSTKTLQRSVEIRY